jgi:heavy metal sensor kinase
VSIRVRLTLWYTAVLTSALALFGALIFFSLQHRLLSETDRELEGVASRFQDYFLQESARESNWHLTVELREFCQALSPATSVSIHGANGFVFRYPANLRPSTGTVKVLHHPFTSDGVAFQLEVAISTAETMHTLQQLRILLLGLTPLFVLVASIGGTWISRRALKPVNDLADAARIIGIENLSERLKVPPTGDELAKLTQVLNTMFARLESAVKTLSQFAADASHELRTPLAVIRTTAELSLRRPRSVESYRASLEQIETEAQRMTQLVEDLLTLARSDAQRLEISLAPLDISALLENVCAEMASLADLRQIEIRTEIAPRIIEGNRNSLHRLFLVLLDNAIKYSNPGGRVLVKSVTTPDQIRISVEDNGAGIKKEDLTHIFKRFYCVDTSRTGAGHGLGLSLAESIAKAHGASIEVESNLGVGSRFDVVFPVR